MHSAEFNRTAFVVLGSILFAMLLVAFTNLVFAPPRLATPGYLLPSGENAAAPVAEAPKEIPVAVLLAKADPHKGEQDAKVCTTCHNFAKGAGAKIGPDLYDVVGRHIASVPGFDYSTALKALGGDWTYEKLFHWISDPRVMASGTKMAFAGEHDPQKDADILAYLQTLSEHPVAFPKPSEAPAAAAPAPAAAAQAAPAPAAGAGGAPGEESLPALLAQADAKKGEQDARICGACHNFKEGQGAKIGPDLWGVVGRPVGSFPGFNYSDSLKKIGGDWTYEKLFHWIADPKAMAGDTKMIFPGDKSAKKRADILAFLQTLSNKPVPFPK